MKKSQKIYNLLKSHYMHFSAATLEPILKTTTDKELNDLINKLWGREHGGGQHRRSYDGHSQLSH